MEISGENNQIVKIGRQPRINVVIADAVYHAAARGNNRDVLFLFDFDYRGT
ncbi:MAG: hypothetical protein WC364_13565 [Eubacteriales bacterium]|jgi:hypothetical protein